MGNETIAFFNHQLASMLRAGIPLEAGLKQLCGSMKAGVWKTEGDLLAQDLARGTPLPEALKARKLPPFYVQMLCVGARGDDLPGMLTLLADHYHRRHLIWTRLQGLMVYPTLVLCTSLLMSLGLALTMSYLARSASELISNQPSIALMQMYLFLPVILLALVLVAVLAAFLSKPWRQFLLWKLPAFREAALAEFASTMVLMLRRGVPAPQALELYCQFDDVNPINRELQSWQTKLASGSGKISHFAESGRCIPPLFVWLLSSAGEDLISGFERASEVFQARTRHLTEIMLYAALPIMILFLGGLIVQQVVPAVRFLTQLLQSLGS